MSIMARIIWWRRSGRVAEAVVAGSATPRRTSGLRYLLCRFHTVCLLVPVIGLAQAPSTNLTPEQKLRTAELYFRNHQGEEAKSLLQKYSSDSLTVLELMN